MSKYCSLIDSNMEFGFIFNVSKKFTECLIILNLLSNKHHSIFVGNEIFDLHRNIYTKITINIINNIINKNIQLKYILLLIVYKIFMI